MIEPLYPRGGLLGGSSSQTPPKISKLAALAAARKKKENQSLSNTTSSVTNTSVSLLDKLGNKSPNSTTPDTLPNVTSTSKTVEDIKQREDSKPAGRKYPVRLRRNSKSAKPEDLSQGVARLSRDAKADSDRSPISELIPNASPSIFAETMFGSTKEPLQAFLEPFQTLHTSSSPNSEILTKLSAFAGPSPDDVVLKAQNASKGSTQKGRSPGIPTDRSQGPR